jgi:hypothetical protein
MVAELFADRSGAAATATPDQLDVWTPSYMARINPISSFSLKSTLLSVCERLACGTRRVVAMTDKGEIVKIISQSLMAATIERIVGSSGNWIMLENLGIKPKKVHLCHLSDSVLTALKVNSCDEFLVRLQSILCSLFFF